MSASDLSFSQTQPRRLAGGRILFVGFSALLILFLTLPLVALVVRALPLGIQAWLSESTLDALQLSLTTATIATLIAFGIGTPVAYLLAREKFRGKAIIDTLIDLPMVLPPSVAGLWDPLESTCRHASLSIL